MARIRSVHPQFFTDEDLVTVSAFARLLFIGLGVQADDKGIFEWKPVTLKMRLFPADSLEVPELLEELVGANCIAMYELDERKFGAIRNFRKYQRPKTPNDVHPIPDDFRNYVGLTNVIAETEAVNPTPFPPKGEKHIQMKDGGDKDREKSSAFSKDQKPARTASSKYPDEFETFWTSWKAKGGGGDKSPAYNAWKKLSASDKEFAASVAVRWFEAWRKATPDATAIHASTYLNERRFDGFEPPSASRAISAAGKSVVTNADAIWPALVERKRQETGRGVNAESWAFDDEWIEEARAAPRPISEDSDRGQRVRDLMSNVSGNSSREPSERPKTESHQT